LVSTWFTLIAMKKSKSAPLGLLLLEAFRWFDDSLLASFKELGWQEISPAQSLVLTYLAADGIRISELARRLGVSRQAAQKSVTELEQANMVLTEVDPSNSSAKIVSLTKLGQTNVAAALEAFAQIEQKLSKRIGDSKVAKIRKTLELDWGDSVVVKQKVKATPKVKKEKALDKPKALSTKKKAVKPKPVEGA
jgi:DNA-binding MarR family transcriptional regulator